MKGSTQGESTPAADTAILRSRMLREAGQGRYAEWSKGGQAPQARCRGVADPLAENQ